MSKAYQHINANMDIKAHWKSSRANCAGHTASWVNKVSTQSVLPPGTKQPYPAMSMDNSAITMNLSVRKS